MWKYIKFIVHGINARNKLQLHKTTANFTLHQKGVYYVCTEIFNELPQYIAEVLVDKKYLILNLKKYLVNKSSYSLEELIND